MVSSLGHCIDESSIFAVDKQEEIRERLEMRSFCLSCCACVPPAGVHVRTTMVCSRFKVVQRRDALLGLPCISSVRQGLGLLAPGDRSAQQQKPSVSPMDHRYMPLRVCFLLRCLFLLCHCAIPFACCLLRERYRYTCTNTYARATEGIKLGTRARAHTHTHTHTHTHMRMSPKPQV